MNNKILKIITEDSIDYILTSSISYISFSYDETDNEFSIYIDTTINEDKDNKVFLLYFEDKEKAEKYLNKILETWGELIDINV